MNFSTSQLQLTRKWRKEDILARLSEDSIFAYLGLPVEEPLGSKFCSPFRPDTHPDCKLLLTKETAHLRFYDPALGESLDWIGLVMYSQDITFAEALLWVVRTFGLEDNAMKPEKNAVLEEARKKPPPPATIQIRSCPMSLKDKLWWKQFNIDEEALFRNRVWAISDYWLNGRHHYCTKGQLAFCYKEDDGYKLYFPEEDKKYKWRSTTRALACYDQLPQEGKLLVITSSKKDAMCLASFGYHAIAPQGEGVDIPASTLWELKKRFTNVVIFYDNDFPGLQLAHAKCNSWQVTDFVYLPFAEEQKDPAAYCATYGVAAAEKMFHTILTPYAS